MASSFDEHYNPYGPKQTASMPNQQGMWTIVAPDGTVQYVSGDQLGGAAQQPSAGQQLGSAAGQIGGHAAGQSAYNAITGGGSAAPSAPNIIGGTQVSTSYGTVPGASVSSGASGASSGYPATEALLQGGSQEGIAQGVSAAPTAAGGSGWLGATGASPYLAGAGYAAGAYTGMQQGMGAYHAVKNEPMSLTEQAALALPTFGLSFAYNPLRKMFGSRKGQEQLDRDAVRSMLKEKGFTDDKYNIDLPNGQKFNIGKDGGEPWYNVDFTDPNIGGLVAAVQPLAAFITGGNKKLTNDFAGYLTNAAHSGGDPMENVMALYQKTGMGHDQIYGAIHLMSQPGPKGEKPVLDQATADAYKNGLDQLYGVGAYEGQGPKFGTPPASATPPKMPNGMVTGTKPVQGSAQAYVNGTGNGQVAPNRGDNNTLNQPPKGFGVGATPPPSGVQNPTARNGGRMSPFVGSANYSGKTRISPGVWADQKGQYMSKTGERGK